MGKLGAIGLEDMLWGPTTYATAISDQLPLGHLSVQVMILPLFCQLPAFLDNMHPRRCLETSPWCMEGLACGHPCCLCRRPVCSVNPFPYTNCGQCYPLVTSLFSCNFIKYQIFAFQAPRALLYLTKFNSYTCLRAHSASVPDNSNLTSAVLEVWLWHPYLRGETLDYLSSLLSRQQANLHILEISPWTI